MDSSVPQAGHPADPTPGPVSRENLLDRMIRAGRFACGLVEVRALFTAARRAG